MRKIFHGKLPSVVHDGIDLYLLLQFGSGYAGRNVECADSFNHLDIVVDSFGRV